MHAVSSYRSNLPTHTQTHTNKQTHRQDRLQYTAPLSLARRVTKKEKKQTVVNHPETVRPNYSQASAVRSRRITICKVRRKIQPAMNVVEISFKYRNL